MTRFPILFETLTGQPADPKGAAKAERARIQRRHGKSINQLTAIRNMVNAELRR